MNRKRTFDTVDDQTLSYYKRVSDTLREGFESTEDKELFLTNVFKELTEDAIKIAKCTSTCVIFENLIQEATSSQILCLMKAFSSDWDCLCTNSSASYVVQKLVYLLPKCLSSNIGSEESHDDDDDDDNETDRQALEAEFLQFCSVLNNSFDEFFSNKYASHIIRSVLEVLGGCRVEDKIIKSRMSRGNQQVSTPKIPEIQPSQQFQTTFEEFATKIFDERAIQGYGLNDGENVKNTSLMATAMQCTDPLMNPVMQTVLLILHTRNKDLCAKYLKKIISTMYSKDRKAKEVDAEEEEEETQKVKPPDLAEHDIGSFLIQQMLRIGNPLMLNKLYRHLFKKKTMLYAMHPVGNFVLQTYLTVVTDIEQFDGVFKELSGSLEDILAVNHVFVIVKLAEACIRLGRKQGKLVKSLMEAFHCSEPVERQSKLAPLIATLTTYEVFHNVNKDTSEEKFAQSITSTFFLPSVIIFVSEMEVEKFSRTVTLKDVASTVWRKGQNVGLVPAYSRHGELHRLLLALPYLPAEHICSAFKILNTQENTSFSSLRKINFHGSLILQNLLKFGNPQHIINSLLELSPPELKIMMGHPSGSRIIDAFFTSESVGEKSRDLFLNRMKGSYTDVSCNKYGSRTMEIIWKACNKPQKEFIAEELVKQEPKLLSDRFGYFLHSNFHLQHFIHRRNDWLNFQKKQEKKRKLFEDILQDSGSSKKKKMMGDKTEGAVSTDEGRLKEEYINSPQVEVTEKLSKRKKHKNIHENDDSAVQEYITSPEVEAIKKLSKDKRRKNKHATDSLFQEEKRKSCGKDSSAKTIKSVKKKKKKAV